ncbi:helix-turn-helix transcriptional regulator [Streptomyces yaizuensis]|uniref:Helix-turn-helix transcriptional regulator n=1 Tax=Streptomyces yaizuensis TaxID=2989713 RepID=A0ABQ5NYU2_9ACTN|nr:AAA family ATPase [Streptomyces sp. YSPA8]GLF95360.1 helix-turn-helix transcriptional regulator [Streptomyces sp. YSPA8]
MVSHFGPERPPLIGRQRECAALDHLLHERAAGRGGALVICGEAGIGKSALLEYARSAPGPRVLRAEGIEFETDFAFAALHQLCGPVLTGITALPAPQREDLETAFGLRAGAVPNRFRVGLALLHLLSSAAERTGLICVVDDAQWLDATSAQALAFAARRVGDEPIALVFAVRDPATRPELRGLPRLVPAGLAEADARGLLLTRIRAPLDPRVRERILAEARGNPLALLELPRSGELAGGFARPDASAVPAVIESSFRARLAGLPARTRTLLLMAAAEPTGTPSLLLRAAAERGIGRDDARPAEDAGLISFGEWVRFRHPLVRSAVYRSASAEQRRTAHGALARVTHHESDDDRRCWHLAQAAVGPDGDTADAMHRSAARARVRGGPAAAAVFLAEAARLTPQPALRAERALAAAVAKHEAGALDEACALLSVARTGPLGPHERARARILRARIAFDQSRDDASVAQLLHASRAMAAVDLPAARASLLDTLAAAVFVGRFSHSVRMSDVAETARDMLGDDAPGRPLDLLLDALTTQTAKGFTAAVPLLRRVVEVYGERGDGSRPATGELWLACCAAMDLWEDGAWISLAERQLAESRAAGALTVLPVALSYRALAHIHTGRFDDASVLVTEAYAIADEVGAPGLEYVEVTVAAWRGEESRTLELAELARAGAELRGEGRLVTAVEYARAVLFNGLGRYDAALEALRPACRLDEMGFHAWLLTEFLEAAARAGDRDSAEPALRRLLDRTESTGTDWARGVALRSRALLAQGAEAEECYREAIARLDRTAGAVHAARARLVYGEWLRREGRRLEARTVLRAAHERLSTMGAGAFAARAARELDSTGEHPRGRRAPAPPGLTAQEFQIARLVATGATSKEIGTQLFLSPRTIDAHLRSIFGKLGISSRRDLRQIPLDRDAPSREPHGRAGRDG